MAENRGIWIVWGVGIGGSMFDGFMLREPSSMDEAEDLIQDILLKDPEWPIPNYDVEDLAFLNSSFILEVRDATEQEIREEVDFFRPEARGYFQLR
jgi:hypothetical protein